MINMITFFCIIYCVFIYNSNNIIIINNCKQNKIKMFYQLYLFKFLFLGRNKIIHLILQNFYIEMGKFLINKFRKKKITRNPFIMQKSEEKKTNFYVSL